MGRVLQNIRQFIQKMLRDVKKDSVKAGRTKQETEAAGEIRKNVASAAETLQMGEFEEMMDRLLTENTGCGCLILAAFDKFDITPEIVSNTEAVLKEVFRECAIMGTSVTDGFALWLPAYAYTAMNYVYLRRHTAEVNDRLLHPGKNITTVTISVGAAFCNKDNAEGAYRSLYKSAFTALQRVKDGGGCGCEFFRY